MRAMFPYQDRFKAILSRQITCPTNRTGSGSGFAEPFPTRVASCHRLRRRLQAVPGVSARSGAANFMENAAPPTICGVAR